MVGEGRSRKIKEWRENKKKKEGVQRKQGRGEEIREGMRKLREQRGI